jgi:hypothetical protein
MDAAKEPTGKYLRRVLIVHTGRHVSDKKKQLRRNSIDVLGTCYPVKAAKTHRKYLPVGSTAASLPQTVLPPFTG